MAWTVSSQLECYAATMSLPDIFILPLLSVTLAGEQAPEQAILC